MVLERREKESDEAYIVRYATSLGITGRGIDWGDGYAGFVDARRKAMERADRALERNALEVLRGAYEAMRNADKEIARLNQSTIVSLERFDEERSIERQAIEKRRQKEIDFQARMESDRALGDA